MDRLVQWFPQYEANLESARRFWAGHGRYAISMQASAHYYGQCFDEQKMVESAIAQLEIQGRLPGLSIPSFLADYGTVSMAAYFGGRVVKPVDGRVFIKPAAQTIDEALALQPRPPEDPELDAARAVRAWRRACEALDTDRLWLRVPDTQGPLNLAAMVMNQEELMVAMVCEPQKVHRLLEKLTGFSIAYQQYFQQQAPGRCNGGVWPCHACPSDVGVTITEDMMPLLSPDLYAKFALPSLAKIHAALGPLHVHICGQWEQHVQTHANSGLAYAAFEFHHPAITIEELAPLAGRVVFVPFVIAYQAPEWRHPTDYYRHLLSDTPSHYRYYFVLPDSDEQYLAFAEEFGPVG